MLTKAMVFLFVFVPEVVLLHIFAKRVMKTGINTSGVIACAFSAGLAVYYWA